MDVLIQASFALPRQNFKSGMNLYSAVEILKTALMCERERLEAMKIFIQWVKEEIFNFSTAGYRMNRPPYVENA